MWSVARGSVARDGVGSVARARDGGGVLLGMGMECC